MNRPALHYIPPLVWMGAIFLFSTATFSGDETGSLLETIISDIYSGLSEGTLMALNWVLRKAAHLAEYATLAVLWTRAFVLARGLPVKRAMLAAFIISALYAVTDEAHQAVVPTRDGSPLDILLDCAGAGLGAAAARMSPRLTGSDGY